MLTHVQFPVTGRTSGNSKAVTVLALCRRTHAIRAPLRRFRKAAMETARTCTKAKVYTKVPDGGWGWVVAVAFFFVEVFTYGVIKTFGVFFSELITYFEESNSRISWIISICVFVMTFTAPLSTVLSNRFGHRPVVMAGGILVSLGMVTASFARSVEEMYLTIGLVSAITALKDHLGWRHSLLLVGVLQLNIVVCGSLLRPMKIQKEVQVEETPKKDSMGTEYILENEKTLTSIDSVDSGVELATSPQKVNENLKSETKYVAPQEKAQMLEEARGPPVKTKVTLLDFSVLKNCSFICYSLFGLFATLAFFAPSLYIIPLGISLGIDKDHSAYMLSAMAIAEVFGRIGAGWILNKKPIRKIYIEIIFVILLCLALISFAFATEFWGLTVCSAFYGCMLGSVAGTHIPMLADDDVVGIEKMSSAVGVYVFIQSIAGLAGPPLGGVLVDATQNYGSAFYSCAIGMTLAAICLALVRPCKNDLCRCKPKQSIEEGAYKEKEGFKDVPDDFLEMDLGKSEGSVKSTEIHF
ncbi:hypothetical protein NDU88_007823 [Pleurodeles waltl]|uniref:Monocarboxylate transporter 7 n=1 Tax=Pleurodeles waltl TaxID=8319 RepID=A0AAV7PRC9_PLEWA|nr:hypothetical protein NDU88_007823 [Pleurodeles waltl]